MKRGRENDTTDENPAPHKKQKMYPTKHDLHRTLKKYSLPVSGTKKQMLRRLELWRRSKPELVQMVKDMCPDVHIPLHVTRRDLVSLIPKFERYQEMILDDIKAKLHRNHRFVYDMPAETAPKDEYLTALVESVFFKTVGAAIEDDEAKELDELYRKKDLMRALNGIDPERIRFPRRMTKDKAIEAFRKYILDIESMTKAEIRDIIKEKYPDHIPLTSVNKKHLCQALARLYFHDEFGGETIDNPKDLHVDDLIARIEEQGLKLPAGLHRDEYEHLYDIFVDHSLINSTKYNIRLYLDSHQIPHTLTNKNTKKEHIKVYEDYYKNKYHISQ